ncbi:MAG: hypothetical protein HC835_14350 [Oscillatoriales cyanobacterium RM2_1_1]|nr:hypothetical protein [Oscillatoriales cyanobacterium SM2_3_0]NJO46701.1 hypothetical protein [Oscillatoriales cyanobacterium RM2_1_1]
MLPVLIIALGAAGTAYMDNQKQAPESAPAKSEIPQPTSLLDSISKLKDQIEALEKRYPEKSVENDARLIKETSNLIDSNPIFKGFLLAALKEYGPEFFKVLLGYNPIAIAIIDSLKKSV